MSNEIYLIKIFKICFFRKFLLIKLMMQSMSRQIDSFFVVNVSFIKIVMYFQS